MPAFGVNAVGALGPYGRTAVILVGGGLVAAVVHPLLPEDKPADGAADASGLNVKATAISTAVSVGAAAWVAYLMTRNTTTALMVGGAQLAAGLAGGAAEAAGAGKGGAFAAGLAVAVVGTYLAVR